MGGAPPHVVGGFFIMRKCLWFLPLLILTLAACPKTATHYTTASLSDVSGTRDVFDDVPAFGAPEGDDGQDSRDVVEPDIYRRDGSLLYILNQFRGLTIVDLNTTEILSQTSILGFPRDLYLVDGLAYVLVAQSNNYEIEDNALRFSVGSRLFAVDVVDPSAPEVLAEFAMDGDLVDSRMVGNILYTVTAEYQWYWDDGVIAKQQTSGTWITSVNVADPGGIAVVDRLNFDGFANVIHTTPTAIFVAAPSYSEDETVITYVDIDDAQGSLALRGDIAIPGDVADRFKMDAWQGVLRVVSNTWRDGRRTLVTTVDLADPDVLATLGQTELESALGDTLFATRFDGDRAYIVTYFLVDPFYIVDLSDPTQPLVTGELEVPGWSVHLQPMGNRIIALGVDDTDGRRVSVSLFDVEDPAAPALVERVSFGDGWSWSEAFFDVKAFSVLDGVVAVPVHGYDESVGSVSRLQFVSFDVDDLAVRGTVDVKGSALRTFEESGQFFTISAQELLVINGTDLDDPVIDDRLVLAEYVADYIEVNPDLGLIVVDDYLTNVMTVRTVDANGIAMGSVDIETGSYVDIFVDGDTAAIVSIEFNEDARYRVALIDISVAALPAEVYTITVPMSPFFYYYGAYAGGPEPFLDKDVAIGPGPIFGNQDLAFFAEGRLVLRGTAEEYDVTLGDGEASEGVAIVDIDLGGWVGNIGLGLENISSIDESGGRLYVSTESYEAGTDLGRPLSAVYLRTLTLDPPQLGPAANVPGHFLQYDRDAEILTLTDYQWAGLTDASFAPFVRSLRTANWDEGAQADAVDEIELPMTAGAVKPGGTNVYYDSYSFEGAGYFLDGVAIDGAGDLSALGQVTVTDQWAWILGAHETSAFVVVGGQAIARYDFSGPPTLTEAIQTNGYPSTIRFGADRAYIPVGYQGVVTLPK
jgi:uncharacterized secreted protein with C-terminal beta-propeller domain